MNKSLTCIVLSLMLSPVAYGAAQTAFDAIGVLYRAEQYDGVRDQLEKLLATACPPEQMAEGGLVLGLIYEMDLRWPQAQAAWKKSASVTVAAPAADAARERLAWLDVMKGKTGDSLRSFVFRRLVEESRRTLQADRPRAAVRLALHARDLEPGQWTPHMLIATALLEVGDLTGARAASAIARDRGDDAVKAQVDQFVTHLDDLAANTERYADALDKRDTKQSAESGAQFEKIYRADPARLDSGMAAALQYADGGLNQKAIAILKDLEHSGPRDVRTQAARLRSRLEDVAELGQAKEWLTPAAASKLSDPGLDADRKALEKTRGEVNAEMEKALAAARKRREQQSQLASELKKLEADFETAKMEADSYTGNAPGAAFSPNAHFQPAGSAAASSMLSIVASTRLPVLQIRLQAISKRIELLRGQLDLDDETGAAANRDFLALQETERKRDQQIAERSAFANGLIGALQKGMTDFQRQMDSISGQNSPLLQPGNVGNSGNSGNAAVRPSGSASERVSATASAANSPACRTCAQDPQYLRYLAQAQNGSQLAAHQATVALVQCNLRNGGCGSSIAALQSIIDQSNQAIRALQSSPGIALPH